MQLENREPDERVNYAVEHPLKEFAWLVGGVFGLIAVITLLLGWFAGHAAAWLPYRHEADLAASLQLDRPAGVRAPAELAIEAELNALAGRLSQVMALDPAMRIRVHYDPSPVVNAFATLGGNIVMYRGLLEKLPDENTLAMVLAHEIAHIKLRHPVRAAGRGVAVGVLLTAISAGMGRSSAEGMVSSTGMLTLLSFSREQEREADSLALAALQAVYGHTGGSADLFNLLQSASNGGKTLEVAVLATHPLNEDRVSGLAAEALRQGWSTEGTRQPLSATLLALRRSANP